MASAEDPETRAKWLLNSDLRTELIYQYALRTTSPVILAARLDKMSLSRVAYHTNVLVEHGLLELARKRAYRGTCEHFFRIRPDSELAQVDGVRRLISSSQSRGAA